MSLVAAKNPIDSVQEKAGKLFMQNYPFIRHLARMGAPSADLIDDIVNDAYVSFIENAARFDLESDVRPLLRTIVTARAHDLWRARSRTLPQAAVELWEIVRSDLEAASDPALRLSFQEELDALNECLGKLSPEAREMIQQVYFDGLTVAEIARVAGQNPANLYKMMLKIRLVLRTCVENRPSKENRP